ncbi:MAG: methylenetetrahydrofolate reductase C-terminal domain-containing protein [Planctomycetaceae bacterium]|nr:methylenetetrahydrofolate reductase C-terminal domain-containing protein [Planctomycetaceae bacterium]
MTAPDNNVTYREMLGSGRFYYGAEVVTTRGIEPVDTPGNLATFARGLLADPRIGWISITDNPGGGPMLPPDWLAGLVASHRQRVVLHLTCKDMNRNAIEAAAWRYASEGFENILAITGDYPTGGFRGLADPVFDLDSVSLITLLASMNAGLQVTGRGGKPESLPKTNFYVGCAVSPFKRHERELVPQYFKLVRKIAAGARWVIPQLGYDMRKFHEVKLFLETRGINVPVIGNVYLLTKGVAKLFNSGKLAGCVVSDELLRRIEKYAAGPDKGKKFCQELAAKQLAVFKGLGFAAGYIGGIHKADGFGPIIDLAESYQPDDWRDFLKEIQFSQPDEFFFFDHDLHTGQSSASRINREYLSSLRRPAKSKEVTVNYRLSRLVHRMAFTRDKALYPLLRRFFARWDRKPGFMSRMAYRIERISKLAMYGCKDCGDCSLPDCAYLCPKKWCSKCARNGPCGGSADGRCELDDKECFWARIYQRLKSYGESETMLDRPVTIYNASLKETSSWANAFLDRDHNAPQNDR